MQEALLSQEDNDEEDSTHIEKFYHAENLSENQAFSNDGSTNMDSSKKRERNILSSRKYRAKR